MLIVTGVIFFFYCVGIMVLIVGWRNAFQYNQSKRTAQKREDITVIVPMRNEEENILLLLDDLSKQNDTAFEVLVIDDHSNDQSAQVVQKLIKNGFSNLKLFKLDNQSGKKQAITLGVKEAAGSIIITTDADCRVGEDWVSSFRESFESDQVKMVFGGVRINQHGSVWSSIQAMEFGSLVGTGAAMNELGFPSFCNGANLAYRKDVFEMVDGYSGNTHIFSGDDEFLLLKVNQHFPGSIRFVNNGCNVVETRCASFPDFVQQRLRWAGKWRYQHFNSKMLAALVFSFHLWWMTSLIVLFVHHNFILMLSLLTIKASFEFVFLRKVMRFLDSPWRWTSFIFLQLTYSVYVLFFGLIVHVASPKWKGRKISGYGWKINHGLTQNH